MLAPDAHPARLDECIGGNPELIAICRCTIRMVRFERET